jgi:predicted ATP-grasp superfamily ATP-dependent carboligase
MTTPIDVLVLNASLRQSLVTVRSLGRRGLAVAAVDTLADVPAFRSRWCRSHSTVAIDEATPASVASLEQLVDRLGARVLIPCHDGTVALLRPHRARLEQRVRIALASEPAISVAVNKDRTLALAQRLGIGVPRSVSLTKVSQVPSALAEIGLPAVVKPTESWLPGRQEDGQKGMWMGPQLVTTPDEARRAVSGLERVDGVALFQTLLSGRREAVSLLYANGEIHARFAQWAKRMNPPLGGESVLRQSIPVPPDIGRHAERLVREIELEGYSEIEFRRDAAGVPYLMEINPRLSASVEIAVRSGVDFPHLLYQWASGGPIDRVETYRLGGWMRYLQGDLMTTIAAIEQRGRPGVPSPWEAVLGFGASFLKPMRYDYLDWTDPRPAVKAMTDFTRDLTRSSARVVRRTLGGLGRGWAWSR